MTVLTLPLINGRMIHVFALFELVSGFLLFSLDHNVGLINARIIGGNNARGRFLAFIDAHVMVSYFWLETPHKYLSEVILLVVSLLESQDNCQFC